ncbi:TSUP family transporter [Nocardiopsis sp. HNM0947]|uniref:Probable membrane transporter protein n=1 Tax=Nocardiopsis coralli TaxID=2772213 RepID=A0ABR9P1N5_9ACTN|nr:TSUP family transporter [Nocardiopsis coralli]MBE2997754.1 TSUP family transporter [Nocardiopsis coralli]
MELLAALLAGFAVAAVTTPVGVSGAVLLLPVQIGVLGLHGPAVSATNLLYNVVSTPLGLQRLARGARGQRTETLTACAVAAPCALAGAAVRVTWLSDPAVFRALLAVVLTATALRLLLPVRRRSPAGEGARERRTGLLAPAAGGAALLGAAVGIGGGSLLAPVLVGAGGWLTARAAVVALATTLTTSAVGLSAYAAFDAIGFGAAPAAPAWGLGLALGAGGALGALVGSGLGGRLDERYLRPLLGTLLLLTGAVHMAGLRP